MAERKFLGNAKMSQLPGKKLNFTIKEGAITTEKVANKAITMDKLSDNVVQQIESGDVPADLNQIVAAAVEEAMDTLSRSIERRLGSCEYMINSLNTRVTALEHEINPDLNWYVGQCIDDYQEGVTNCVAIFNAMSTQELLDNAETYSVNDNKTSDTLTLTKPVFYAMIPESVELDECVYGTPPFETYVTNWVEITHKPVSIDGTKYLIYATMNTAFVSNPTPGHFSIF